MKDLLKAKQDFLYLGDVMLNKRQMLVYSCLKKNGVVRIMSHGEIARELNIPFNQVSPRINELRKMKMVKRDKERICHVTGRKVKTWTINKNRKRDSFDMTDLL